MSLGCGFADSAVKHPTPKNGVITVCSDGRSEGHLSFFLIHLDALRPKIQVFSTRSGPKDRFSAVRAATART
jgi:hypothetical protein